MNHITREESVEDDMEDMKERAKASSNASLSSDSEPSGAPEFENGKGQTQLQTPGTCSSGYISEAFSSSNLTNEDSLSIKSNAGDFTPDKEVVGIFTFIWKTTRRIANSNSTWVFCAGKRLGTEYRKVGSRFDADVRKRKYNW